MNRFAGIPVVLAAGLAIGVAGAATPPIVVGPTTTMTAPSTTTTAPAPAAAPVGLTPSASLSISSSRAGERPVAVTLTLRYEMQCGNPGTGSLIVNLPAQEQLPASFPLASALLNGKHAHLTVAAGKELVVALPARRGVLCDVIGPGKLTLVLTKAAKLGNPVTAGPYAVSARAGSHSFHAALEITA